MFDILSARPKASTAQKEILECCGLENLLSAQTAWAYSLTRSMRLIFGPYLKYLYPGVVEQVYGWQVWQNLGSGLQAFDDGKV